MSSEISLSQYVKAEKEQLKNCNVNQKKVLDKIYVLAYRSLGKNRKKFISKVEFEKTGFACALRRSVLGFPVCDNPKEATAETLIAAIEKNKNTAFISKPKKEMKEA